MSFFSAIGNAAKGVERQINPFDGGATFNKPTPVQSFNNIIRPAQPIVANQRQSQNLGAAMTRNSPMFNGNRAPGSFIGATPLSVESSNPTMTLNPNSTPKSQAIFAPMNSQTQQVVDKASKIYGFTPQFKALLNVAQPQVQGSTSLNGGSSLKSGAKAAGLYFTGHTGDYTNSQALQLAKGYGSQPNVVAHEGLHAVYNDVPGTDQAFQKAYQQGVTPEITNYLNRRLANYAGYKGQQSLSDIRKVSPSIRTEVHSYLSEYPDAAETPLPSALNNYYSRYLNPNQAPANYGNRWNKMQIANQVKSQLGEVHR